MSKSTLQRQKLIADLIEEGKITSQNQLKGMLKKEGMSITQATLSRDLTEIGASKKRDSNNNLKYILPKDDVNNAQKSIAKKALRDFVLSVEPVSNQVIIKTTTAAAQVVAEAIDNLYVDGIAASIAGGILPSRSASGKCLSVSGYRASTCCRNASRRASGGMLVPKGYPASINASCSFKTTCGRNRACGIHF